MSRCSLVLLSLFSLSLLNPGAALAQRKLSLSQAVDLALKQSPRLLLEQAKVDGAEATRKSTRGLFGPKLLVEGNIMVWDDAQAFNFDVGALFNLDLSKMDTSKLNLTPQDLATLAKYGDALALIPKLMPALTDQMGGSEMNVRDQVTGQLQVTLAQPLTPLLQVYKGHEATQLVSRAATMDLQTRRVDVAHQVTRTYLQLMQTLSFVQLASTGVKQVQAHLARAQHFHAAGMIGKHQVLKARLELARAKERVIKARYGASLASSALAMHMGLASSERIVPTEVVKAPPSSAPVTLERCLGLARKQRTELRSMLYKREAAQAGQDSAKWGMLPQVSAAATYMLTKGQEAFMPEHQFFFGGFLKWDVWDWGHKYYAIKAAGAKVRQAKLGQRLLRDGVALQVKKAYLDLQQSLEAMVVARAAITEAEENFRLEQRRFEANTNTSTDVLDAQLALTRAKLTLNTSLYSYHMAQAALDAAMGQGG